VAEYRGLVDIGREFDKKGGSKMSKKKMFTQNDELVEFAAAIKTISNEEIEAKLAAIIEQEADDTARVTGRRPLRIVEDAETATETVVTYDDTIYDDTIALDATHRPRRARKGDKADHEARKAAYWALKGYHDNYDEYRRDYNNLKRLSKYGPKPFENYPYVSKVLSYLRCERLSYGRGYDPYYNGDLFTKPILVGKVKTADALALTDAYPEDTGSIWDKTEENLFEYEEIYYVYDHGDEYVTVKKVPKEPYKSSLLAKLMFKKADGIRQKLIGRIRKNLPIYLINQEIMGLAEKGFLTEKAFVKTRSIKQEAKKFLIVVKDPLWRNDNDPETIRYINSTSDILEEVIRIIP
jgi:hypothetical protein